MRRFPLAATMFVLLRFFAASQASAQNADDLNLQIHGYATQAFIYSNQNNWNTTNSTEGSAAWTEAVANVTAQPDPRLRIGIQARYFILGNFGNKVIIDWASGEFKFSDRLGFRAGKVKSPTGMLNETQDIDPAHLWVLLPQSIYPVASRTAILAHYGGIVFGTMPLGERFGKLEYRAYGGERVIPADDGYLEPLTSLGLAAPSGLHGRTYGGSLRWRTPLPGLMFGAADGSETQSGPLTYGPYTGNIAVLPVNYPFIFGRYDHGRYMFAAEYNRVAADVRITSPSIPPLNFDRDQRSFYVMASRKLAGKLTGGAYYSYGLDRKAAFTNARYQKDWTVSGRYDFDPFLYLKAEQHFIDGTLVGFSLTNNTAGLSETSRLSLITLGVSF